MSKTWPFSTCICILQKARMAKAVFFPNSASSRASTLAEARKSPSMIAIASAQSAPSAGEGREERKALRLEGLPLRISDLSTMSSCTSAPAWKISIAQAASLPPRPPALREAAISSRALSLFPPLKASRA